MKTFTGKAAVVTGAASGIGRALAERFAAADMKVVLADIEDSALTRAVGEMQAQGATVLGVLTDVSKAGAMETLAQKTLQAYGAVHILCNNAGVAGDFVASWAQPLESWEWVLGGQPLGRDPWYPHVRPDHARPAYGGAMLSIPPRWPG